MSPQQKKHGQPSTILRRNPGTGARRRWLLGPQRDARAVHGARLGAGNRAGRGPDRAAPGPGPGAPQLEAPLVAAEAQRQPFRAAVFGSAERRAGVDRPCCLPRLRRTARKSSIIARASAYRRPGSGCKALSTTCQSRSAAGASCGDAGEDALGDAGPDVRGDAGGDARPAATTPLSSASVRKIRPASMHAHMNPTP